MTHTAPAPRHLPTGSRRTDIARRARAAARTAEQTHPALGTPGHLRDAARSLERGNTEAAKRHLRAAMNLYTPVSLYRHGVDDDEGHTAARQGLAVAHRLHLQVQEVEDTEARNRQREALPKDGPSFSPRAIEGLPTGSPGGAKGNQAMNAPARGNAGRDRNVAGGPEAPSARPGTALSWDGVTRAVELAARSWDDVARAVDLAVPTWDGVARQIDLSARTAMLERTPAPRGKPGGPGLYDVKGLGHTPYLQQIVKALIEKRGMDPGKAYAIARGAIRRWMRGGGHVHPEVRAAAAGAEAGEVARQARAKASHGHANDGWGAVELAISDAVELVGPHGYVHGWVKVAGEIASQGKQISTSGKGDKPDRVGYHMQRAAEELEAGHRKAALAHLHTAQVHSLGNGSRVRPGIGLVHAPGLGPAHSLIEDHIRRVQRLPDLGQSHSNTWDAVELAVASVIDLYNPQQQRVPKGQPGGGQFGSGKQGNKGTKAGSSASRAREKAELLARARADRTRARALAAQIRALQAAQRKSNTATKQATKAGSTGKTKSSTPAKKSTAAKASSTSAASASAQAAGRKIAALRGQIRVLLAQAAALTAQAAKL